jgi:hypothetical protein
MAHPQAARSAWIITASFKARTIESRNAFLHGLFVKYILHDYIAHDINHLVQFHKDQPEADRPHPMTIQGDIPCP